MILLALSALLVTVSAALLLLTSYLVALALLALRPVPAPPGGGARRRFAILVPAHDEQQLIGRLLASLAELDYPMRLVTTYVVADNCSDATADIARSYGARVHERTDALNRGKGFALRWLLGQIDGSGLQYDAFVVLDADSIVSANFLRSMDNRLQAGSQVIQAHYSVLNASASPVAGLRCAALAAVHYLRPRGRAVLGLSCGLKGNGMCFAAPIVAQFGWSWLTLAEDVEFHLALVRAGVRVDFAAEASVQADMPVTLEQAASQNTRWERGRLELLRGATRALIVDGLRQRSLLRLDAAAEQLLPPTSLPAALSVCCVALSLAFDEHVALGLSAFSLLGQFAYFMIALALVRAPWRVYASLFLSPVYVAWKLGLYATALTASRGPSWVRTARVPRSGAN